MGINKIIAGVVLLFGLLLAGLAAGGWFSQELRIINAAPSVQQTDLCTDDEENNDTCPEDETNASPDQLGITREEAQAVAEAAFVGAKTLEIELDWMYENGGALIFEVELDNGIDVAVDAGNGDIIATKHRNAEY